METILIVDDQKNYPRILGAVLEEEGFEVLTANSGKEALDILTGADVDLVLTDMKMPVMDGIALLGDDNSPGQCGQKRVALAQQKTSVGLKHCCRRASATSLVKGETARRGLYGQRKGFEDAA